MSLIDFPALLANSLWVFALAIALTVFSFARFQALHRRQSLDCSLSNPGTQLGFNLAGLFFCLGLALAGRLAHAPSPWWETALWALLAILFAVQAYLGKTSSTKARRPQRFDYS